MEFALLYALCILEFISMYYVTKAFLQISLRPQCNDIIICLFISLITALTEPYPLISFLFLIFTYTLYISYCYTKNISDGCFLFIITESSMYVCQFIITALMSFFHLNNTAWYIPYVGNLSTLMLEILLFQIPCIANLYQTLKKASLFHKIITINIFLLFMGYFIFERISGNYGKLGYYFPIFVLSFLLFIIVINVCLVYYEQQLTKKQQELYTYQVNMPIYDALIHEIRGQQHEYSNHIQALGNLPIICKDYASLRAALNEYTASYSKSLHAYPLLQINMPLLAASLYHLAVKAENEGIQVHFDIATKQLQSHIPEYELSDLVCILTQNAIEACNAGEHVYIHISSEEECVDFEIRNPVSRVYTLDELGQFFQKNYSSKNKSDRDSSVPHGYGLYTLKKKIQRYKGILDVDCVEFQQKNWIVFHLTA